MRRHPPTGRWTGALAAAAWMFAAAALAQQAPAPVVIPPAIDAGASSSADQSPRRRAQDSDAGFRLDLNLGLDSGGPSAARNEQRGGTRADLLSDGLERAGWLQRAGALGLAERVLIDGRPALERTDEWIEWERRLWAIYRQQLDWAALAARIDDLPADLPDDFLLEARSIGVEALMQQRRFDEARSILRKLLLSDDPAPVRLADWRRKVFTTYVWDDDLVDANIAMRRYQLEYYPDDHNWNLARARVMIRSGDAAGAVSQVASVTTPEGELVGLFGRLASGSMTASEVIRAAVDIDTRSLDDALKRERFALIAEAARRGGLLPDRVRALEQALGIEPATMHRPLIEVASRDLVDSYLALAQALGNAGNLLVGDFDAWLKHAENRMADSPVGQRALFAYVGLRVGLPELANQAFSRLAASLRDNGLKPVIFELFGEDKPLGGFEMLRGPVGYLLSDEALEAGDIRRAAALSASINQPPAGVSYFDWRLRQARMSIYAGRIDEGVATLDSLTGALDRLAGDETDRLLQVIFDLQALDRHAQALPLLDRVLELVRDTDRQREVLFWLAESLEGTGAFDQAALHFLRSATMAGSDAMWSQSARYRAAGALEEAGLIDDARAIYRQLLAETGDAARRDQLTRRLQDLWLLENKAGATPGA